MIAEWIAIAGGCICAYLAGALPTGYLIAKFGAGVDIRSHGSKNVGATNVYRVAGKLPGFLTLIVDIAKGIVAVIVFSTIFYRPAVLPDQTLFRVMLGGCAISGHVWNVFLGFNGGKGVATMIGVLGVLAPQALACSLVSWIIVFALTNFVSAGSIAFSLLFPVFAWLFHLPLAIIIFSALVGSLSIYKHKTNIARLLRGEENKTYIFKKKPETGNQ